MKHEIVSFLVKNVKPRNVVAKNMLDRNGPYRDRTERVKKNTFVRRPKNAREAFADWE